MIKASKWLYISLMKKILVCPLDWGIGHATRCVPIIHLLMKQGHEVIIAADGRPYAFLCREFPGNKIIRFPGFRITYARNASMMIRMLKLGPSLLRGVRMEHLALKKIVEEKIAKNKISLDERNSFTEKINVVEQMNHLMKYPYIRKRVKEGTLTIMGWYYHIEEGEIYNYDKRLKRFVRVE